MFRSEKQSLFRFLAIYLSSTLLLFLLATIIFYNFQKEQILTAQYAQLDKEAQRVTQKLKELNEQFNTPLIYPYKTSIHSAIYNLDREYIFGSFIPKDIKWKKEFYQNKNRLYHIHKIYPYYLGASYLVISKELNKKPIEKLFNLSLLFMVIAGLFFTFLGLFLGKLFIAPMKESMKNLNQFIQDTTHELNTPISTILNNIELINSFYECDAKKEMSRIETASKTLSRLYDDLTYLKLNHNYHRVIEPINLALLLEERINYFQTLIEAKELTVEKHIEPFTIKIDKNDAIRLMDNLLSNAIKYSYKGSSLIIMLNSKSFTIKDRGEGIKEENIETIQKRFKRDNNSEGGFGIGLDIVSQVVKEYGFKFKIDSIYQQGTEVKVLWEK